MFTKNCPKCGNTHAVADTLTNKIICPDCGTVDPLQDIRSRFLQDMQSTCRLGCGCIVTQAGVYIMRCPKHALKGGR